MPYDVDLFYVMTRNFVQTVTSTAQFRPSTLDLLWSNHTMVTNLKHQVFVLPIIGKYKDQESFRK